MEGPRGMQNIHGQYLGAPGLQELEAFSEYVERKKVSFQSLNGVKEK